MATLDQNLTTLDNTKTAFKTKFTNANVSTTDVAFTNYPNLIDQMEKILPTEVKNVTPTTSLQSITATSGYRLVQVNVSGVTSAIDSNIQAGNIKKNVTILGVTGNLQEGTDVSDTTATASDVLSGKDFYLANGAKTTGTIPTYSGSTTITQNGTVSTSGKYLTSDITVNVSGGGTIVITIDDISEFPSTETDGAYVILLDTPIRVWYGINGVWVELPQTVTETLNAQGGYTITIGTTQYSEAINAQNGYTMTIGGSN